MAYRIHVTAVRDCAIDEVRATFLDILGRGFEQVQVHEHSGWVWFSTSVWGVRAKDLNQGLCRLARPGLQFTTCDGDRWILTVHGGPRGRVPFLHPFSYLSEPADPRDDEARVQEALENQPEPIDPELAFLEDDPEAPVIPLTAFDFVAQDFADFGSPLPETLCDELRDLPYSQAINRLRDVLAEAIPEAMARAGIPVDTAAVRRVLLWENVTENEQGGDLGNLPRLLAVLGLGDDWDEYVQQAEQSDPPITVSATAHGFGVGLLNRVSYSRRCLTAWIGQRLAELLIRPPEGTVAEVAFAVPGQPATHHRFRGTVRDSRLWIEESHPPLSHDILVATIYAASYEQKSKILCRDEAEAEALLLAVKQDRSVYAELSNLKRSGARVSIRWSGNHLAINLLRLRSGTVWDFGPRDAQVEEDRRQAREMRRNRVAMARQRAAPRDREVLFKGRHSWYWRSDFLQLDQLDPEPREAFEQTMTMLGFSHVGDLVLQKQRDIVLRVFQSGDRFSYAVLMGKRTMYLGIEYVSRLADGSGLTTTTNSSVYSVPKAGIYYRAFPGMAAEELHRKHIEGLDRFRLHKKTGPVPLEPTLEGVAREIERAFDRREAADRREAK